MGIERQEKMRAEERYIPGYEGTHVVSSLGYVRKVGSQERNYGSLQNRGYYVVRLPNKTGKVEMRLVHRLVAQAFLDNPEGKTQVDHIDTNKLNNRVDNLRWVWPKENAANYRTAIHKKEPKLFARKQGTKSCVAYLPDGKIINANSMAEMARRLDCSVATVSRVCNGEQERLSGTIRIEYSHIEQGRLF